ncbi:MAG TPA: metallophosphoesterase [Oscillospiraceae bacterium]|nr:metallophosphoesterase [Oscillospiraceae bacterium]HPS33777.1 metallophosphoesterase [Oscillospiraceae bacterium]
MIYVTGDMHGDMKKLKNSFKGLKKGDTLLIAGDFGFIWKGDKAEEKLLKKIGKNKFDICFIDGANENHELLMKYPLDEYRSGEAAVISGNLRMLRRGSVFEIEGKKIFAFGGAKSEDIESKQKCGTWHAEELPNELDFEFGRKNLEKYSWQVDYILTHQPSAAMLASMEAGYVDCDALQIYLDEIGKKTKYAMWIFGRLHRDRKITYKCTAVFKDVFALNPPPLKTREKK